MTLRKVRTAVAMNATMATAFLLVSSFPVHGLVIYSLFPKSKHCNSPIKQNKSIIPPAMKQIKAHTVYESMEHLKHVPVWSPLGYFRPSQTAHILIKTKSKFITPTIIGAPNENEPPISATEIWTTPMMIVITAKIEAMTASIFHSHKALFLITPRYALSSCVMGIGSTIPPPPSCWWFIILFH